MKLSINERATSTIKLQMQKLLIKIVPTSKRRLYKSTEASTIIPQLSIKIVLIYSNFIPKISTTSSMSSV